MKTTTHHIVMTKLSQRNLNEESLTKNQLPHLLGAVGKAATGNGWIMVPRPVTDDGKNWLQTERLDRKEDDTNRWAYELHFALQHNGDTEPGKTAHRSIAKALHTRGQNPLGGRWALASIDGTPYEVTNEGHVSTKDFVAYAPFDMPEDFESPFDHLYGLDSHVARVRKAIEIALLSEFTFRYHVALIGPPGCGKSDICRTLKGIFGDEAVMEFDGTQTTAAGAMKALDEAEILPRILLVEEIEKVAPEALSYLLALMDERAELRKTTAKKTIMKDAKILVVATVNNYGIFRKILAGALASRFANPLFFHRPSAETIGRILRREISKIDGDEDWIAPVTEYANEKNITDPRMIAALCLTGRDAWLDGSYVKMLADTDMPQDYEDD